jgi:DNA polymerase-3 subunit delta'
MTSYIIQAQTQEQAEIKAREICQQFTIGQFDITIITPEEKAETTKSLGIDVVKSMQKMVFYKPLKSSHKAVILKQAQLLTIPAQNALLKLLEEPPDHTLLFLLTSQLDVLLSTILSRCSIITLETANQTLPDEAKHKASEFLASLPKQSVGDVLKKAQDLAKQKDAATDFVRAMTLVSRQQLLEQINSPDPASDISHHLFLLQDTYKTLSSSNTNPRMALEHLFLALKIS